MTSVFASALAPSNAGASTAASKPGYVEASRHPKAAVARAKARAEHFKVRAA
jgi:hypothetical protein